MKRRLVLVLALLGVLVVAALFLLLPGSSMPARKKIRLPDGNIVTVEKVTYNPGSQHDFSFEGSGLARFGRKLPRFLRRYFPSMPRMSWNTTSNSLVLWFTLADGKTGAPLDFHARLSVEVVDEHGCSSRDQTYGSMSSGSGPTIYADTFSQFPRRQAMFRVRLRERPMGLGALSTEGGMNKVVAEFEVPNPTRGPFPAWKSEPLPAARTNAELVFVMRDAGNPNLGPAWSGPRIDILRGGLPAGDWERDEIHVSEANGNRGQRPFCTNEPAWKLEVDFLRNVKATFLPTEMFTVTNLTVPASGEAVVLTNEFSLQGNSFEVCALAGSGHYVYSNTVLTIAEPLLAGQGESSYSSSMGGTTPIYQLDVRRKEPHFALMVPVALMAPSLANEERLLVRARFRDGLAYKLVPGPNGGRLMLYTFSGVTNAGPFELDVIVHRVRRAEFYVKPPVQ